MFISPMLLKKTNVFKKDDYVSGLKSKKPLLFIERGYLFKWLINEKCYKFIKV